MKRTIILSMFVGLLCLECMSQEIGLKTGNIAPELAYKNPNGKLMKLSDLKGKLVLIEFWASWCRPCRNENPNIVNAYQKYSKQTFTKGNGFEIFSVSLDNKKNAWKKAIKDDNLYWKYHVSDLGSWNSKAANDYKIRSIPSNILIDAKGIIIARNLRGKELHLFLESLKK